MRHETRENRRFKREVIKKTGQTKMSETVDKMQIRAWKMLGETPTEHRERLEREAKREVEAKRFK